MTDWRQRAAEQGRAFWLQHNAARTGERRTAKAHRREAALLGLEADFGTSDIMQCPLPPAVYDETVWGDDSRARVGYALWPVGDSFVRVGETADLPRRVEEAQLGSPRPLLAVLRFRPGRWDARRLHARFAAQLVLGEWLAVEGDFGDWIRPAIDRAFASWESK